jgi:Trypsin-co-occurring domain 1
MPTTLIRLSEGTLVEAEVAPGRPQQVSGGAAEKVAASLDKAQGLLEAVARPLSKAWPTVESDGLLITEAQVEVGIAFEGEGNAYICRATASANLVVTLKLTRSTPQ